MPTIKVLSDDLIGKIAAGEVVERPASVVKELVENSIDAGAHEILVAVEEGGKRRIIVVDDGCGMNADDARLSVMRHATSKIGSDADLFAIRTMGFRGEALPSIAAVSKLTIETKFAPEPITGFKLVISGGRIVESGDFGCADGTRIVVEDLFFNTPARKKFLRSDKTEEGHIIDAVSRIALAFPDVRFRLTADGKEKLSCLSVNNAKARLLEVFDGDFAAAASFFEEAGSGIKVCGFLGGPDSARSVAQGVYIFVNRRFVRDRTLNHAVVDGCRGVLAGGSYPFAVVMLDVDPARVDVNVHPTKQEVRFDNIGAVHNFVASAVRKAVQKRSSVIGDRLSVENGGVVVPTFRSGIPLLCTCPPAVWQKEGKGEIENLPPLTPSCLPADRAYKGGEVSFNTLQIIGQLAGTYILCEGEGGRLVAIDQHAAHERIGFERLKAQLVERRMEQQQLLIPVQVELLPVEAGYISEHIEILNRLGIEIEPFGGKTFLIKAVPQLLADADIVSLVMKLARELSEIGRSSSVEELTEHILKTMACHRQVRANHILKDEEMRSLLQQMDMWPNTRFCPHGRPTYIEFSPEEIAKWFKRS